MRQQFISGDWTTPAKFGTRRRITPLPQIADIYEAFEQDYTIARGSFAATAFNTASEDDAAAYLQAESPALDLGNEMIKWTRSYYHVPPSWDDFENVSYTFPAYPGFLTGTPLGRSNFTPQNGVTARVQRDYFMVGAGQTYATSGDIPLNPVQTYTGAANPTFYWDPPTVVPAGGITLSIGAWLESVPTRETWDTWVANAAAQGWASTPVGTDPSTDGQIVVACKLERFVGNIWARATTYVLAL